MQARYLKHIDDMPVKVTRSTTLPEDLKETQQFIAMEHFVHNTGELKF